MSLEIMDSKASIYSKSNYPKMTLLRDGKILK